MTEQERQEIRERMKIAARVCDDIGDSQIAESLDDIARLLDEVERQNHVIDNLREIRHIVAEAHQDNLEKMQAENERLRKALEEIAETSYNLDSDNDYDNLVE